jgi:hypothetical protein
MSSIAISPSMTEYFRTIVADAIRTRQIEASDAAEGYLVGLLCDYAHPGPDAESTLSEPLTFLLRDALDAAGPERFRRLRVLGDGVLYTVGFFGGHIELRGVDRSYVYSVGRSAYDQAAAMLRLGGNGAAGFASLRTTHVLAELATKFERFAAVLADVADGTLARSARDERSVVKLYERWLRTGSERLADELGARGLVPTRGKGGVH